MSVEQFSRGRAVYAGGSYAPTRGQVSAKGAQGYLKRELNKNTRVQTPHPGSSQWGKDGQSDTRSGIAKAALKRKDKAAWGPQPGSGNPGTGGTRPPIKNEQVGQPGGPTNPTGNEGGGSAGGGGTGGATAPPPEPTVVVNEAGQLQLPYSAEWGEGVLGALQESNQGLLELQSQQQQQALDYMKSTRNLDTQYTDLKRDTLSDNAGRGTAFSSAYGTAVGRNANQYNTMKNDLISENALANTGFDLQRAGIYDAFNDTLRQAALRFAEDTSNQAGELGYGQTNNPIKGDNKDKGKGGKGKGKGRNQQGDKGKGKGKNDADWGPQPNSGGGRQNPLDPRNLNGTKKKRTGKGRNVVKIDPTENRATWGARAMLERSLRNG